ncbi:MAG: helix-turn-helix domain-containing protein [Sphingomonadales bacterium]|nr:helix-turn-helix domain-containing protein [Sphingomonadales bacterium]MDE2567743.1 helix-turn-helix domain-containing protein [Sphingomonadales bacterium]
MTGPVRSVSQAFAILRLLASRGDAMTLSDIARGVGLSPSSCLNLLRTLVGEGLLLRDGDGRRYRLAVGWAASGLLDGAGQSFAARARPALERMAAAEDAAIGLWQVMPGERIALIALAESGAATRIHMAEGQRQPLGGGATGRALAASDGVTGEELARRYGAVRWQRPLTIEAYAAQVAAARVAGYAIDDNFGHAGICSLGAVVPGAREGQRFCLSASVFAGSREPEALAKLGAGLAGLARTFA